MEASHRNWDPEVESPATIAVIGGGPTGIEAALYAVSSVITSSYLNRIGLQGT